MDLSAIIARMIKRKLTEKLLTRLQQFPAVALLGPRQVGKTTLAHQLGVQKSDYIYLDLENPQDLEKLEDARGYLAAHQGKLVILDEVQRMPGLFQILRGLIDESIRQARDLGSFSYWVQRPSTCYDNPARALPDGLPIWSFRR